MSAKWFLLFLVLVLIVIAGYYGYNNKLRNVQIVNVSTGFGESQYDQFQNGSLTDLDVRLKLALEKVGLNATECPGGLPKQVFEKLPAMPGDFFQKKLLYESGTLTELDDLSENYWKQPCWLPTWNRMVPVLQNPPIDCSDVNVDEELRPNTRITGFVAIQTRDGGRYNVPPGTIVTRVDDSKIVFSNGWQAQRSNQKIVKCAFRRGTYGYGISPGQTVISTSPGENFVLSTYVYTSVLVETYQALSFNLVYRESPGIDGIYTFQDGSKSTIQDPKIAKEYVKVIRIPTWTLLEPAFPQYSPGFAQKLQFNVSISKNAPCNSKYAFGIVIGGVNETVFKDLVKTYGADVVNGGTFSIGRPHYEAFIDVLCAAQ